MDATQWLYAGGCLLAILIVTYIALGVMTGILDNEKEDEDD